MESVLAPPSLKAPAATRERRLPRVPILVGVAFTLLGLMFVAALCAPLLAPYDPNTTSLLSRLKPPFLFTAGTSEHLLGTDALGRDTLSRILHGYRISLAVAAIGMLVGLVVGTALGIASGLLGGWVDHVVMMLVEVQAALPFTLVVLTVLAVLGVSTPVLVTVIGLAGWEGYARLLRGQVLAVREQPFVEAARALGAAAPALAWRHVLPNVVSPLLVMATMNFGSIVLLESSLSFLGLGVQPPTASLGRMVGEGREYMTSAWWVVAVPSLAVVLITVSVSLIGDWLRDTLDRRLST